MTAEEEFLLAFSGFQPLPAVVFEYRIYFDPITRICQTKTIDKPEGEFVVVNREEYDDIAFCPNYKISKKGKIILIRVDFAASRLLQLNDAGTFCALKDNNIFLAPHGYTGVTENWGVRTSDTDD